MLLHVATRRCRCGAPAPIPPPPGHPKRGLRMSGKRLIGIVLTATLLLSTSVALAKKKKGEGGGEFQPEAAPAGDQPSKVLERAFKLYDGEDYYSASIELNKVVEGESGDTEGNKQKAEFWMAKALY